MAIMKIGRGFRCMVPCHFMLLIYPLHSIYRAFEDEKKAKMGVVECCKHQLLEPFNVLWEKEGQ